MKKILLATSALVTAGVLASPVLAQQDEQDGSAMMAMSDETSISIWQEFGYSAVSDNQTTDRDSMFSDGELTFNFASTSDAGLHYSADVELEVNPNQAANGIDEASMSLSTAEFGTLTLGANDDVSSTFATYLPGGRNLASGDDWKADVLKGDGTTINNGVSPSATGANYGDDNKIAYRSPNFGGFSFGTSYSILETAGQEQGAGRTGDEPNTSFGARYSMDFGGAGISIQAASVSDGESSETANTQYGINVDFQKFSVAYSTNSSSRDEYLGATAMDVAESGNTLMLGEGAFGEYDATTTGLGAGYHINDEFSVAANFVSSEDDTSSDKLETVIFGLSYTIAPGLNFAIAMNQYDFDANDDEQDLESDEVRASIQVSF